MSTAEELSPPAARTDAGDRHFAFWRRYLLAVSALFGVLAVAWMLIGSFDPFGVYERWMAADLWGSDRLTPEAKDVFRFALIPLGATTAAFFLLVYLLVKHALPRRERWAFNAAAGAAALWFVLDTAFCLVHAAFFNVLMVNLPCAFLLGLGLVAISRHFGTGVAPGLVRRNLSLVAVGVAAAVAVGVFFYLNSRKSPDVGLVKTPYDIVGAMLELAGTTKDDVVYDLGCGDGRYVITAAKKYGCRAVGVDIDPECVAESRAAAEREGVSHLVEIRLADIFKVDLSEATVVTLYLMPDVNVKLIPQLNQMKPGSRVVSNYFDMQGVTPAKFVHIRSRITGGNHPVYLWTVPLKQE